MNDTLKNGTKLEECCNTLLEALVEAHKANLLDNKKSTVEIAKEVKDLENQIDANRLRIPHITELYFLIDKEATKNLCDHKDKKNDLKKDLDVLFKLKLKAQSFKTKLPFEEGKDNVIDEKKREVETNHLFTNRTLMNAAINDINQRIQFLKSTKISFLAMLTSFGSVVVAIIMIFIEWLRLYG